MTDAGRVNLRGAVRSMLLVVAVCVTVALLLVALGVAVWVWVIGPALGPHRTADGSSCSEWSGHCMSLSKTRIAGYSGIVLPAGATILASHSEHGMKDATAYGLICTGDPDGIVTQARAMGYLPGTRQQLPTYGLTGRLGTPKTVLTRNSPTLSEWEQVTVGGSCDGAKTRVLLTYFWNG